MLQLNFQHQQRSCALWQPQNSSKATRRPPVLRRVVLIQAGQGAELEQKLLQNPFLLKAVNALSVGITNSPLNTAKKWWFRRLAGEYDLAEAQTRLKELIQQDPVVMFSWTQCTFCKRAKALLNDLGVKYTVVEMDTLPKGMALKAELGYLTNRTSVPNIFIQGKSYGGMMDGPGISRLHERGELVPLLQQAGVL